MKIPILVATVFIPNSIAIHSWNAYWLPGRTRSKKIFLLKLVLYHISCQ